MKTRMGCWLLKPLSRDIKIKSKNKNEQRKKHKDSRKLKVLGSIT